MASITHSPNKITFSRDNVGYKISTLGGESWEIGSTIGANSYTETIFPDGNDNSLVDEMNDYAEIDLDKPSLPNFSNFASNEITSISLENTFANASDTETLPNVQRYVIWGEQYVADLQANTFQESKSLALRSYRPKKSLLSKTQQEIVSLLLLGNFVNNVYLSATIEVLNQDKSVAHTITLGEIDTFSAGADKYQINMSLSYANLKAEILNENPSVDIDNFFGLNITFFLQEQVGPGANPSTDPTVANSTLDTLYYKFDLKKRPRARQYLWLNRLGGWEVMRALGKRVDENKYTQEIARRYRDSSEYFEETEEVWHVDIERMFEQSSGFWEIDSKKWKEFYQEFFESRAVYEIQADNSLIPVNVESKKYESKNDDKELRSLTFKAKYSTKI